MKHSNLKLIARLALRNLVRNRHQTALTAAIVALGAWTIIVIWGLIDGSIDSMLNAQISLDTSDMQVHRQGYLDDPDLANTLSAEQLGNLDQRLKAYTEVWRLSVRLVTEGLLQSAYGSQGVVIRGIQPAMEPGVTVLDQRVVAGQFLSGAGEILLGRALAEKLDIRLGERVVLQAQGLERTRSKGFRLVGMIDAGLTQLDRGMVFIHLEDAQMITDVAGASELVVSLVGGADAQRFSKTLQDALGAEVEVSSFYDLNPLIADFVKISRFEMMPTMLLLAVLAGFGVANTITFTVLKRIREFGVMLSLGLRPKQLSRLIVLESLFISGIGFVIGSVLGFSLNFYLEQVGINYGMFSGMFPDLGIPQVLYAKVSWSHGGYAFIVVVLTALVAARYPARRAAQLEPTEAMRYV